MSGEKKQENSNDDKIKLVANRYKIERKLSKDKNGNTFLVVDLKNNEELKVLKMVNLCQMQRNEIKETLREEAVLSKLDCPYIIKYYESFMNDDNLCIVTEYCEGGDLDLRLKQFKKNRSRLPEGKILHWFAQILSAAYYLHSKKILHRNLKPCNVFIKNETLKIGDFGISRVLKETLDDAQTFIGTPYYMSPEVVKNESYNSKSDVWSLGCILYEMCTYQHPFVGDAIFEVFQAIIKEDAPSVINLYSLELNAMLKRIFTKNPLDRPSTIDLLREPLIIDHVKGTFLNAISNCNGAERLVSLINAMSMINDQLNEDDEFGDYSVKSTIKGPAYEK